MAIEPFFLRMPRFHLGNKNKNFVFCIAFRSACNTLLREDRRRLGIKNKSLIYFVLRSACNTLLREDRRRLGIKNKSLIYFVLRSACTIFAR